MMKTALTTGWMNITYTWVEDPHGMGLCLSGVREFFDVPYEADAVEFVVTKRSMNGSVPAWFVQEGYENYYIEFRHEDFVDQLDWERDADIPEKMMKPLRRLLNIKLNQEVERRVHITCYWK